MPTIVVQIKGNQTKARVVGVSGSGCAQNLDEMLEGLGITTEEENTADFYALEPPDIELEAW